MAWKEQEQSRKKHEATLISQVFARQKALRWGLDTAGWSKVETLFREKFNKNWRGSDRAFKSAVLRTLNECIQEVKQHHAEE